MAVDDQMWGFIQQQLGYTDDEMKIFKADPGNVDILTRAPAFLNKTIVAEVVESHGCFSQHKVGDRLYLDAAGNLLTGRCPDKVCCQAVSAVAPRALAINELMFAGVDPNDLRFKRVGCPDVGLQCGGWGRIVMEVKVEG